jgi:hypothetical protein
MNRCNDEIEISQDIIGVIQASVIEDIALYAFKNFERG